MMKNSIEQNAISNFRGGLNCAQAVVTAYADAMQFDKNLALSISCGFGGGMGRLQKTCGAVTGSFMVMGIHNCGKYTDNTERKDKTYAMVKEFSKRFTSIHGTLDCRDLMHCDMNTDEGKQYVKDNNLHEVVCEKCIADAIGIISRLLPPA